MVDIIEGYETEEQQVEAIKGWWKENGNTLIIGAVVGLAGLWGWRFYNESVISGQEQASQAYSDMLVKFEAQQGDKGLQDISLFATNNVDNSYGVLASLLLAKEAVVQKNYLLAKTQLQQLQSQNSYAPLNSVINLRLARIQLQLGEYPEALSTLALITDKSFLGKAYQVKGSIFLKQEKLENARTAFQDAINASQGRVDPALQLQFDDLAQSTDSSVAAPILDAEK
ncbi:YfgM family protein [Psychromonas antarctica]|uniref:YfgM family protein n=1 Tax=Psychromonas antarctica TaxID=67573 RepID=UPI001EE9128F|nr:tetratricopeptide repeat protein [Psychromonas antarctica]